MLSIIFRLKQKIFLIPLLLSFFGISFFLIYYFNLNFLKTTKASFSYQVRSEHPRIFINSDNINEIRQRAATVNKDIYLRILNSPIYGIETHYNDPVGNGDLDYIGRASIVYVLGAIPGVEYQHTPEEYGMKAKEHLIARANTILAGNGRCDCEFPRILEGYDWLYPLLNSTEKKLVVDAIIYSVEGGACIWHGKNFMKTYSDFGSKAPGGHRFVMAGLAFYGDGNKIGDGSQADYYNNKAKEYCDDFFSMWWNGVMAAHEWQGIWMNGLDYTQGYVNRLIWVAEAWATATNINPYQHFTYFKNIPLYYAYGLRPENCSPDHKMTFSRLSDVRFTYVKPNTYLGDILENLIYRYKIEGDLDTAGLAKWLMDKFEETTWYANEYDLLWYDPTVQAKSPKDLNLPLTKRFRNLDWVYMRSAWQDPDATFATFVCQPYYFSNHDSPDNNAFTISKKGQLAIRSGCYEKGDKWEHEKNYHYRTIAHNTIIVYDPDEVFKHRKNEVSNDGGQRWWMSPPPDVSSLTPDSKWATGGIKRFESVSGEYDYIFGDATRAYQSTLYTDEGNDPKISLFTREFVYLRSPDGNHDYFVVFDRVNETQKNFNKPSAQASNGNFPDGASKKRWLLHTKYNPTITGTEIFVREGKWSYTDVNLVTITDKENGGKLFLKTLLPYHFKINKIGGENPDKDGRDHNFEDAEGNNYPCGYNSIGEFYSQFTWKPEYGAYRIEIEPTGEDVKPYNLFLNVLYPTIDSMQVSMPETQRIESSSGNMVGTFIKDPITPRVVMFSKTTSSVEEVTYTLDYPLNQTAKHLIVDLVPNKLYYIYKNGTKIAQKTSSDQGTLYFESTGGSTFTVTQQEFQPTQLTGDLNQDNKVNSQDFQILIQKFKETQNIEIEDLNSDGIVDIKDIGILMHYWNE